MLAIEDLVRIMSQLTSLESLRKRTLRNIRPWLLLVLHFDEQFGPAPGNAGTGWYVGYLVLTRDPAYIRRPRRRDALVDVLLASNIIV